MDLFSNLKADDLIVAIAALLAAVPGLIALWQNRKKNKAEVEKAEVETENIHAEIAETWAGQVAQLLARVGNLEKELVEVKAANRKQAHELVEVKEQMADYQNWANRLVHQVKKLGHEPEPFVERRKAGYP